MQIDRVNTLIFPPDSAVLSAARDGAQAVSSQATKRPMLLPEADRYDPKPGSVVVRIQSDSAKSTETPVYSDGRKSTAAVSDDADLGAMALEHQQAIDRNAGTFTQMTLGKDGVLSAKQMPASTAKPPDFVTFAVTAMRDYADEAERLKKSAPSVASVSGDLIAGKFRSLQQLAAKFSKFA